MDIRSQSEQSAIIDAFVEQSRSLDGREIKERELWHHSVTDDAIRHFCYGISDDNPLWLDASYASEGPYGCQAAPPAFLTSVLYPLLHGAPIKIPMVNLISQLEFRWQLPILCGDKIDASAVQLDVLDSKERNNRRMVQIVSETTYWNQRHEIVAKAKGTIAWVSIEKNGPVVDRQIYKYNARELNAISDALKNEIRTGKAVLLTSDLKIGADIPELTRGPLCVGDLVCWQAATGPSYRAGGLGFQDAIRSPHTSVVNPATGANVKYSQQHEDFILAPQRGMPAPFDNGVMRFAWVTPLLTNWMGDYGFLKRLRLQLREPHIYGDTIRYRGKIDQINKSDAGDSVELVIEGKNQFGAVTTIGDAEVFWPAKKKLGKIKGQPGDCQKIGPENNLPENDCIHELIKTQAQKTPNAIATVFENEGLTYRQLDERTIQLSLLLKTKGVSPDIPVGIFIERSNDLIAGILAVLQAGGAYVPLDTDWPAELIAFVIDDAHIEVVLTQSQLLKKLPDKQIAYVLTDSDKIDPVKRERASGNGVQTQNTAYIMYTSGSSNKPKGVAVAHSSLSLYIASLIQSINYLGSDIFLHTASAAFSASVRQTFLPLCLGATLVIANERQRKDPAALFRIIKEHHITVWDTVPSILNAFANRLKDAEKDILQSVAENDLRLIMATGEIFNWEIYRKCKAIFNPTIRYFNLYSQTETTGTSLFFEIQDKPNHASGAIALGQPIANTLVYLMDENQKQAMPGMEGEICVGGMRLAKGYINQRITTMQRFIPSPFKDQERLYKTGDYGKLDSQGNFIFLGRRDRRIKLHGFRIELDEVESLLKEKEELHEVAVVMHEHSPGDRRLVAFIVPVPDAQISSDQLRTYLLEKLPAYMVPSLFVTLDVLPRTASGKIDRLAIKVPNIVSRKSENTNKNAKDELEIKLLKIWEKVLRVEPLEVTDNFFDLGGDSFLALDIILEIEKIITKNISSDILFRAPTVNRLASLLREESERESIRLLVPIKTYGNKHPFFCVHGARGSVMRIRNLANLLRADQPVYGLQPLSLLGHRTPHRRIEDFATAYLKEVKKIQPAGPYYLGGFSFGGKVAFEMARQLNAEGHQVSLLAIFDADLQFNNSGFRLIPALSPKRGRSGVMAPLQKLKRKIKWKFSRVRINMIANVYFSMGRILPAKYRSSYTLFSCKAALKRYRPEPCPSHTVLFCTQNRKNRIIEQWKALSTGGVAIHTLSGAHKQIFAADNVQELSRWMNHYLPD